MPGKKGRKDSVSCRPASSDLKGDTPPSLPPRPNSASRPLLKTNTDSDEEEPAYMNVAKKSQHKNENAPPSSKTTPSNTSTNKKPIPPPLVIKRHEVSDPKEAELRGQQTESFVVPNLPTHYSQISVVGAKPLPEESSTPTLQKMKPEYLALKNEDETQAESISFSPMSETYSSSPKSECCDGHQKYEKELDKIDQIISVAEDLAKKIDKETEESSIKDMSLHSADSQQHASHDATKSDPKPTPPDDTVPAAVKDSPYRQKPDIPADKPKPKSAEPARTKPVPPAKKPSVKFKANVLMNGTPHPTKPPNTEPTRRSLERDKENHNNSTTETDRGGADDENVTYAPKMHTKLAKLTQLSPSKSQADDASPQAKRKSDTPKSSSPPMALAAKKSATLPQKANPSDIGKESSKGIELMKKLEERRHKLEKQMSDVSRTSGGSTKGSEGGDLSQFGIIEQGDPFIL